MGLLQIKLSYQHRNNDAQAAIWAILWPNIRTSAGLDCLWLTPRLLGLLTLVRCQVNIGRESSEPKCATVAVGLSREQLSVRLQCPKKSRTVDGVIWIERQHHGYQSLKQLLLLLQFKVVHFLKMNSKLQKCHRHEKCFKNDISRRNAGSSPCRLPCLCPAQFSNKWALETISDPDFFGDFTQTPATSFRPFFPFSTVPIFPHPSGPPFHRAWAPVQSHKTAIHFSKAKPDGVQRTLETKQTNTFLGSGSRRPPEHLWQHFLRHLR